MAKHTIGEEWRPVVGYEGLYEVSSIGRVKTLHGRYRNADILKPRRDVYGYISVTLSAKAKKRKCIKVHRLVLSAFVGPADGLYCNHKNGVTDDNRLENLEWVTAKENTWHSMHILGHRHGPRGTECAAAKLTDSDIPKIRKLHKCGLSNREIGDKFGVTAGAIFLVLHGRTWKHVKENG